MLPLCEGRGKESKGKGKGDSYDSREGRCAPEQTKSSYRGARLVFHLNHHHDIFLLALPPLPHERWNAQPATNRNMPCSARGASNKGTSSYPLKSSTLILRRLKNHTDANHILTTQLKASRTRCARILSTSPGLDAHRSLAGTIHQLETQNRALDGDTQRLSAARKTRLVSLRARKEGILRRREALRSVRLPDPSVVREEIATIQRATSRLGEEITHARRILVREALDVFGIRQVEEEWHVAGLRMPAPARFTGKISPLLL